MTVFDTAVTDRLTRRWASQPERDWPTLVRVALLDHRAEDREMIEAYVDRLHPDDRARFVTNLLNEKQFLATLGELVVGEAFARAGERPRYEPEISTQSGVCTPDWLLVGPETIACDVFTAGLQRTIDADQTSLRELEERLTSIREPYVLKLEVDRASELTPRDRKHIALAVARWLSSRPAIATCRVFAAARFEVMSTGGNYVSVITADPMHIVETPSSVRRNFIEKAKKYGVLNVPLIVAAVKHNRAELESIDVENVLFGEEVYVSRSSGVAGIARLPGGVFPTCPELSAAMWLEPFHLPPVIRLWRNSVAARPIAADLASRVAAVELPSW